jgi:hypothetical protein
MSDIAVLTLWTIYFNPTDHPGKYVTRAFHVIKGEREPVPDKAVHVFDTLDEARSVIPEIADTNIGRQDEDEAQIVETWV